MLNLCSDSHDEVCFEGINCPVCDTRDDLNATIEELTTTNETLTANNETLESDNAELQRQLEGEGDAG